MSIVASRKGGKQGKGTPCKCTAPTSFYSREKSVRKNFESFIFVEFYWQKLTRSSSLLKFSAWFSLPETTKTDVVLLRLEDAEAKNQLCENTFLNRMPKQIDGLATPVNIKLNIVKKSTDEYATIGVRSDNLALYVVLTTRAQGRFSDNAFSLRPFETKVSR